MAGLQEQWVKGKTVEKVKSVVRLDIYLNADWGKAITFTDGSELTFIATKAPSGGEVEMRYTAAKTGGAR